MIRLIVIQSIPFFNMSIIINPFLAPMEIKISSIREINNLTIPMKVYRIFQITLENCHLIILTILEKVTPVIQVPRIKIYWPIKATSNNLLINSTVFKINQNKLLIPQISQLIIQKIPTNSIILNKKEVEADRKIEKIIEIILNKIKMMVIIIKQNFVRCLIRVNVKEVQIVILLMDRNSLEDYQILLKLDYV